MKFTITEARKAANGREMLLVEGEDRRRYLCEALDLNILPKERFFLELIRTLRETIRRLSPPPANSSLLAYRGVERIDGEYYLVLPFRQELWDNWTSWGEQEFTLKELAAAGRAMGEVLQFFKEQGEYPHGFFVTDLIHLGGEKIGVFDPRVHSLLAPYRTEADLREGFRPPEVIRGGEWGEKANLYTAGLTLYYLATGVYPFPLGNKEETTTGILREEPLDPRYHRSEMGSGFARLLSALLQKKPENRPVLEEYGKVLQEMLSQNGFQATPEEKSRFAREGELKRRRVEQKRKLYWWWIRVRWPVLVACGLALVFYFTSRPGHEEVITPNTPPAEVVALFYEGLAEIDTLKVQETLAGDAGKDYVNLISTLHVISRMRMAYEGSLPPFVLVEELRIHEADYSTADRPAYYSSYVFKYLEGEKYIVQVRREELSLERIDDKWQIVEVITDILSTDTEPLPEMKEGSLFAPQPSPGAGGE